MGVMWLLTVGTLMARCSALVRLVAPSATTSYVARNQTHFTERILLAPIIVG
jgi:hypothetical protein